MFIDIHCHVMPNVDDGPESTEEALKIMKQAYAGGTRAMVLTPHYFNDSRSIAESNRSVIVRHYKNIKSAAAENNIKINLFLGSEMLRRSDFDEILKKGDVITINGSRYILTEFYFDDGIEDMLTHIEKIRSCGLIPIIAHPERYEAVYNFPENAYRFLSRDCLLQVNKGSFLGKFGIKEADCAKWLLGNGLVHIIASDCHGTVIRDADMSDIYQWLAGVLPKSKTDELLHDNPKKILLDMSI